MFCNYIEDNLSKVIIDIKIPPTQDVSVSFCRHIVYSEYQLNLIGCSQREQSNLSVF